MATVDGPMTFVNDLELKVDDLGLSVGNLGLLMGYWIAD